MSIEVSCAQDEISYNVLGGLSLYSQNKTRTNPCNFALSVLQIPPEITTRRNSDLQPSDLVTPVIRHPSGSPVTADHIIQRNRANAGKSTGPKTPAGKATAAGNARKHGAAGKPQPARVGLWLRIILGRPDLTLGDFIPCDERSFRALALAEAEARLETCQRALSDFEAGRNLAVPYPDHCDDAELMKRALAGESLTRSEDRRVMSLFNALLDPRAARRLEDPGRLLRRYRNEARARRKKAFKAWIDCPVEAEAPPPVTPDEPQNPGFPKQTQIAEAPKKADSRNEARSGEAAGKPVMPNDNKHISDVLYSDACQNRLPGRSLSKERRFSGPSPGAHYAISGDEHALTSRQRPVTAIRSTTHFWKTATSLERSMVCLARDAPDGPRIRTTGQKQILEYDNDDLNPNGENPQMRDCRIAVQVRC